jgi:hypothetical protein
LTSRDGRCKRCDIERDVMRVCIDTTVTFV